MVNPASVFYAGEGQAGDDLVGCDSVALISSPLKLYQARVNANWSLHVESRFLTYREESSWKN